MARTQLNLFNAQRSSFHEQEELTIQSMRAYGNRYKHWVYAWSGGKDSSATLTYTLYLVESGQIEAPERITVLLADTRLELLPLWFSAMKIIDKLKGKGVDVKIVCA